MSSNWLKDISGVKPKRLWGYLQWESEVNRRGDIDSFGVLLDLLLDHLGLKERMVEQKAVILWDEVVGKNIADVTTVRSIRDGVMTVSVINSVWRNELTYMKEDILDKLNGRIGKSIVSDIRFI